MLLKYHNKSVLFKSLVQHGVLSDYMFVSVTLSRTSFFPKWRILLSHVVCSCFSAAVGLFLSFHQLWGNVGLLLMQHLGHNLPTRWWLSSSMVPLMACRLSYMLSGLMFPSETSLRTAEPYFGMIRVWLQDRCQVWLDTFVSAYQILTSLAVQGPDESHLKAKAAATKMLRSRSTTCGLRGFPLRGFLKWNAPTLLNPGVFSVIST